MFNSFLSLLFPFLSYFSATLSLSLGHYFLSLKEYALKPSDRFASLASRRSCPTNCVVKFVFSTPCFHTRDRRQARSCGCCCFISAQAGRFTVYSIRLKLRRSPGREDRRPASDQTYICVCVCLPSMGAVFHLLSFFFYARLRT